MHAGADTSTSTCPLELARDRLSVLSAAACIVAAYSFGPYL